MFVAMLSLDPWGGGVTSTAKRAPDQITLRQLELKSNFLHGKEYINVLIWFRLSFDYFTTCNKWGRIVH